LSSRQLQKEGTGKFIEKEGEDLIFAVWLKKSFRARSWEKGNSAGFMKKKGGKKVGEEKRKAGFYVQSDLREKEGKGITEDKKKEKHKHKRETNFSTCSPRKKAGMEAEKKKEKEKENIKKTRKEDSSLVNRPLMQNSIKKKSSHGRAGGTKGRTRSNGKKQGVRKKKRLVYVFEKEQLRSPSRLKKMGLYASVEQVEKGQESIWEKRLRQREKRRYFSAQVIGKKRR